VETVNVSEAKPLFGMMSSNNMIIENNGQLEQIIKELNRKRRRNSNAFIQAFGETVMYAFEKK